MGADAQPTVVRRRMPRSPAWVAWPVAAGAFGYVYWRLDRAASADGESVVGYLGGALAEVRWGWWVALMVPYCVAYVALDAVVLWRVVAWSLQPVPFRDVLPVRAAAHVLALVNEQVGKGAIAVLLRRRHGVGLEAAASTLVFLMVCEYLSLVLWATVGVAVSGSDLPAAFAVVPWLAATSLTLVTAGHLAVTRTAPGRALARRRPLLGAFGAASLRRYAEVIALRAPLMAAAVGVYTVAVRLFGVPIPLGEMLGYLPVVLLGAATPGPLRSVAVALWVTLLPDYAGTMAVFGVLQHLLFTVVNALIGVAFLRRAVAVPMTRDRDGPRA
jgi:hypothetical protein